MLVGGCRERATTSDQRATSDRQPTSDDNAWFADTAPQSGLTFTHFNGMSGEFYYPEIMPPGVALLDYDNDGDLDRLFRNDLVVDGRGGRTLRFTDVTGSSGIDAHGYGMGAATGDYDNDGCVDLYVTALGSNQLFHNNCNGTFTDVTRASHTDSRGWSVSAAFVDYDRDGWLDLFVGHYLNYRLEGNIRCFGLAGGPDYCPPHVYTPEPSRLYRNNRDGTFTDATAAAGLATEFGPALGVATADFNGDGWIDIYVANDGQPNQLWTNQRDGTFKNTALLAGAALGAEGEAKSSMGVDAADFDNDGDEDLFITELTGQGVDLYVNNGSGVFEEQSARAGLRQPTLPFTGFGAAWLDVDNDGWLDLLTVNGAVTQNVEASARHEAFPLQQRKQLFRNVGGGRFEEVTVRGGAVLQASEVSRGAAFGDIDNDGDIDVVVGNASGPPHLLVNNIGQRAHWIGVRLVGGETPRDMVGARVAIARSDGSTLWRRARSDGSYASANDPRVLAGLGDSTKPPTVRVRWPGGRVEEWRAVPVDRYTTLKEGTGMGVSAR
ncbi:MAG: CRTAC1 family protein [Acidobacteria bacterium]|nr:MAG: CRTAC1 family protein [Acidobacteriota bacterium]